MSDPRHASPNPTRFSGSAAASPAWWIVLTRELRDLWVGGKALVMILIYSVLLGGYSYLLASNAEVALLPVPEMTATPLSAPVCVLSSGVSVRSRFIAAGTSAPGFHFTSR